MTNKPEAEFRMGAIKATIWKNTTNVGHPRYSVNFTRTYKKGNEWKETQSFARDDLHKIRILADDAYRFIYVGSKAENDKAD